MCGTFSMRHGPSASRVAARMGSAAFLLPAGRMVPLSGRPPVTAKDGGMGEASYAAACAGVKRARTFARERESRARARGTRRDRPARHPAAAPGAAASGPGAVTLVARTLGLGELVARGIARAAVLETAAGALAITVPLALHNPHARAGAELGWPASLIFAVGSGALVGMAFLSVSRLRPAPADLGFALLATLLFGAGLGYAADLSPLVVCALAAALIVNVSPRRHRARQVLADWAHPLTAAFLIVTGALLTLPTAWLLVAAPLLALVRMAAKWGG